PGGCSEHLGHELAAENRRHECAKCGAQTKNHRHPEGQSEIAHGQAKSESADTPKKSKEERPEQRRSRSLMQHDQQIFGKKPRQDPWRDDPTEEATREPEGFPCPALHAFVRHIKAAGRKPSQPMIDNSDYRVSSHVCLVVTSGKLLRAVALRGPASNLAAAQRNPSSRAASGRSPRATPCPRGLARNPRSRDIR